MPGTPFSNALIKETSPYLLQHAHNPVEWHAWSPETLKLAQESNKPLLISIGYAACHWCHVMAHESFEDEETAEIMNDNFICIKVDREERPDVDAHYMRAVQMMTGSGGWPLHAFALTDGRPFYGGTYFPRSQWQQLLSAIANEYHDNKEKLETFAQKLTDGMNEPSMQMISPEKASFEKNEIEMSTRKLQPFFDPDNGGMRGAPKFPMPTLVNFLLEFGTLNNDETILSHTKSTLEKMAQGGIYDHIGGGFARYSTDPFWKVPHFEKMLYDNAQLISLYSEAYRKFKEPLFMETVKGSAEFLIRELRTDNGLFASSLDADSEGEEGKFYIWKEEELRDMLGDLYPTAQEAYRIFPGEEWENKEYILHQTESLEEIATGLKISRTELNKRIDQITTILLEKRDKRIRPNLDHKALTSWNGLAIEGFAQAYLTFHDPVHLEAAETAANFILSNVQMDGGGMYHAFTDGKAHIPGFLEDYGFLTSGLISLYQATFNEYWLEQAKDLMGYTIDHFLDISSNMFFFTSDQFDTQLKRDIQLEDGVTPSANSVTAKNMFALARYYEISEWEDLSKKMTLVLKDTLLQSITSYSNWASSYLAYSFPFYDAAICGPDFQNLTDEIREEFHPNSLFAGSTEQSSLPVLLDRFKTGKTLIYICRDKICSAPVESAQSALKLINS